jgi:ornithine carrier protein
MAGFTGKIVEYPFDTIKVRLQSQSLTNDHGALDCLKKTIQNEGYLGLYKVIHGN